MVNKEVNFIKFFIKTPLFLVLVFYFVLHLINLTGLPIFNDEAIYLDWGWRETHNEGQLYYSLYDAKQPLLMWIFGIAQNFFSDPLFAGRFVSVITGAITLTGLYTLSKRFFNSTVALFTIILFCLTPLFVFYNRQALMESSLAAVNVWACYFFLQLLETNKKKFAILLGLTLGIGFFIKTTVLLFLATIFILSFSMIKNGKQPLLLAKSLLLSLGIFFGVTVLLLINPLFWETLPSNSRYSLTLGEIFSFPVWIWFQNITNSISIVFFFLTPLVCIAVVFGIYRQWKTKETDKQLILVWTAISLVLFLLFAKSTNQRYLVPFVPLLLVSGGYTFSLLFKQIPGKLSIGLCLITAFFATETLILFPYLYITGMSKITPYANMEYVSGQTSGYGIPETVELIEKISYTRPIIVGVAENSGNPESAIHTYFANNKKVTPVYISDRLIGPQMNDFKCLEFEKDVYFISRENQLPGIDRFFQKITAIKNPYGTNSIGIYSLKKPCTGEVLKVKLEKT